MAILVNHNHEQCVRIYEAWHERARTGDVEGLLALYAQDAVLETPLIPAILDDTPRGELRGQAALRRFFEEGTRRRPNELVRWYRTGTYLCDGRTLFWEYPRALPNGEQIDIAEVMEIADGVIQRHRIYWGWFGCAMLQRSREAKERGRSG
jgi:ketosteroid isomerase-like protein